MAGPATCPQCGVELPRDALEGLCPQCLLETGLGDSQTATPSSRDAPTLDSKQPAVPPSSPVTRVRSFGDYELLKEIARGGMGVVYKARQVSLNRVVALKMILAGQLAGDEDVKRFHTEAEAAAQLDHPGIVPIYEVGEHDGQHYFSMGFVDGRSLAERLKEGPFAPHEAAECLRKITEAICFAHERDVIHRDLKPGNVLIDNSGDPKVTDFGLAKRVQGDSSLTATGQILGTPSFMPPEQAAGNIHEIKKAADIYALGAILYALLTGRPPFQADNPLDTIMQVLEQDAVEPRRLNPSIPLDLETICLKCLQKEPSRRYLDARELADDLQAFLDDRQITARRPTVWERASRWGRKHRRVTTAVVVSAVIAIASMVGITLATRKYEEAQTGQLSVSTDNTGLVAEVLDDHDAAVTESFPIPNPQPVSLPAGSYRLRTSTPGLPSQTWPLEIERGEMHSCRVSAKPQWLWPPFELPVDEFHQLEVVKLTDHSDLILVTHGDIRTGQRDEKVRRIDGRTGRPVWPQDMVFSATTSPHEQRAGDWQTLLTPAAIYVGRAIESRLVRPAPDLDGDSVGDLVFCSRASPSLVTISGQTGRLLWWHSSHPEPLPKYVNENTKRRGDGTVIGQPAVYDMDGDGTNDLIACFIAGRQTYTSEEGSHEVKSQGWISAISGKTGEPLWTFSTGDRWIRDLRNHMTMTRYHSTFQPLVVSLGGRLAVVLVADDLLFGLDGRSGAQIWQPRDLGQTVLREPVLADLDSRGPPELLVLQESPSGVGRTLTARKLDSQENMWRKSFTPSQYAEDYEDSNEGHCFVEDLDADGKPEIVFPIDRHRHNWRYSMAGLEVLHGASGQTFWRRRLAVTIPNKHPQVTATTAGPDINGDGFRELFVAWPDSSSYALRIFVAALSGKNGLALWKSPLDGIGAVEDLSWWQIGADGWPLLVASDAASHRHQGKTFVLSAATGRITHALPGVREPRVGDFNGDGISDLAYQVAPQGAPRFLVVPGSEPAPWRAFREWHVAQDFDDDGFTDLLSFSSASNPSRLTARSGRNGQNLWKTRGIEFDYKARFEAPPLPEGDVNGDRVPDLFVFDRAYRRTDHGTTSFHRASAISGRDGQKLWTGDDVEISSDSFGGRVHSGTWSYEHHFPSIDWCDMDQDGISDVLVAHIQDGEAWLALWSGKTGALVWQELMPSESFPLKHNRHTRRDLDGDGSLDLIVVTSNADNTNPVFHVLSGSNGKPIWHSHALTPAKTHALLGPPGCGDLNGDGHIEVVVACSRKTDRRQRDVQCELITLAGLTGDKQWSWTWRQKNHDILPPLLTKADGNGTQEIWLGVQGDEANQIVSLNASGQTSQRLTLENESIQEVFHFWRKGDLDGDGKDEVLLLQDGKLCAIHADSGDVLWKWELPPHRQQREYTSMQGNVVDVRLAEPNNPATVVVWANQTVFGVDGQAGITRWKCNVPWSPGTGFSDPPEVHLLAAGAAPAAPRVLCRWAQYLGDSNSTIVRQAWPVSAEEEYKIPQPMPLRYEPMPEEPLPLRKMPWAAQRRAARSWSLESSTIAFPVGLPTVLIIVIPTLLVRWAIRRRSWQLALLPACYAGVSTFGPLPEGVSTLIALVIPGYLLYWGLWRKSWPLMLLAPTLAAITCAPFLFLYVIQYDSPLDNVYRWHRLGELFGGRLLVAVVCAPGLVFWVLGYTCIKQRNWRKLRRLMFSSVVLTVVFAMLFLALDGRTREPWEHYDFYGWYGIFFWGTYATGWVVLLALAARKTIHFIQRLRHGSAATVS